MQYDLEYSERIDQQILIGTLRIQTAFGPIQQSFRFPNGAVTLGSFSRQAMDLCDLLVELARKRHQEQAESAITCSADCGACCRQLVTVSVPEALQMGEALDNLPPGERTSVFVQSDAIIASASKQNLLSDLQQLGDPALSAQEHYTVAARYFALNHSCPFLRNGNCSIYADRFATCREYLVTSPRGFCADPFGLDVKPLLAGITMRDTLAAFTTGLLRTETQIIPVPLVIEYLRLSQELRLREFQAGEVMRKFLPLLEVLLGSLFSLE